MLSASIAAGSFLERTSVLKCQLVPLPRGEKGWLVLKRKV